MSLFTLHDCFELFNRLAKNLPLINNKGISSNEIFTKMEYEYHMSFG
jgi:hypothetical protein